MSLDTWFMIGDWSFLDQFQVNEFLDKMEEVRVKCLAFGGAPPMKPDPRHYKDSVVKGMEPPPETMQHEAAVRSLFQAAKERGMELYFYGTNPHMSGALQVYTALHSKHAVQIDGALKPVESYWGACANAPEFVPYYLGRIMDAHQSFPEIDGFLNDGPEFGYEIAPDFMGNNWSLFACFGRCCERKARELGYDLTALRTSAIRLQHGLRTLDADVIQRVITHQSDPHDTLGDVVEEPGIKEWFRCKQDSITSCIKGLCQGVKSVDTSLKIGIGSRLPAFTPLTGYDLCRLAQHADFMLPKLYLWMGGVDGLYGTVHRWVKTLKGWNPHLPEEILFQFVYRLFDFTLPGVSNIEDIARYIDAAHLDTTYLTSLGEPFPERFFTDVVTGQVKKMIQQVGDAGCVRPWLDTEHGGRVLTPHELDMALTAAENGGLKTYLYYCPLEEDNWEVAVKHAKRG